MTNAMNIIINICSAVGIFWTAMTAYKYVIYVVGVFAKPKYKETENKHKYAICVAARNEEKVIRNLLESIDNQDYPKDELTIFVVADNCTDNTAEIARQFGVVGGVKTVVYEHNNSEERTKGFALRFLFDKIKEDFGIKSFDGYFVFDADNVLAPDYITRMNEAFDAGNEVVTSFRNSKNIWQNWISFSYAMHWMRTCLFEHRGKNFVKLSCRIQGTGFLFANHFVENGWTYTSLTEDRAFCTDVVVQGYRVGYCEAAKFYDEQPYKLKVALRQRVRWSKGHLQSATENCPKLIKNIFKFNEVSLLSFDTFFLNFPNTIESGFRRILTWICQIVIAILAYNFWGGAWGIVKGALVSLAIFWAIRMAMAIVICIYYRKEIEQMNFFKKTFYIFMFPFFDYIGKWTAYIALFTKVEWKPIPHDYVVDVEKFK